jgi:transcription elongation factor SPT5
LKIGDWVRVKSGTYAGDLGQVADIDNQMIRITVKLIPRLESSSEQKTEEEKSKTQTLRPPQRLFNRKQYNCSQFARDIVTQKAYDVWNSLKFRKGFLFKEFNIKGLQTENITPSLDELLQFKPLLLEGDEESEGDEKVNSMIAKQKRSSGIAKGDKVKIIKGELKNLAGTVVSVTDALVIVAPMSKELASSTLQFAIGDVEKYFQPGDFVRVVHGLHKGESGLITNTVENFVTIYSESKRQEIKVFSSDVQSGADARTEPTEEKSKYKANDMIVYNNGKNIGVILSVERDFLNILDSYGETKSIRLQEVTSKKESE